MLLALYGVPSEYLFVPDQVLGSPTVPGLNYAWSTLMCVLAKSSDVDVSSALVDSSVLVSHSNDHGWSRKLGKSRHKCDNGHRNNHTIHRCFVLHCHPPQTGNVR